jgi:hypothetical protein
MEIRNDTQVKDELRKTLQMLGGNKLYSLVNQASQRQYEGKPPTGHVILSREPLTSGILFQFADRAELENGGSVRFLRKLIELSSEEYMLYIAEGAVIGLVAVAECSEYYEITFEGIGCWSLILHSLNNREVLYRVRYGEVFSRAEEILGHDDELVLLDTWQHTDEFLGMLRKLKLGCLVVIVDDVDSPALNLVLTRSGFRITMSGEPIRLQGDIFAAFARIDGAIVMDRDLKVLAIGVILDGPCTSIEDPAHGSRYNSALRFVMSHKGSVAIVRSEDGAVRVVTEDHL